MLDCNGRNYSGPALEKFANHATVRLPGSWRGVLNL